jgi:hypothetical protein
MGDTAWFSLPEMRDRYCSLLDRIQMYEQVGVSTKAAEQEAWEIRKDAYRILARLRDENQDVEVAAATFGWQLKQLDSGILRDWLLKSGENPPKDIVKMACEAVSGEKCMHV